MLVREQPEDGAMEVMDTHGRTGARLGLVGRVAEPMQADKGLVALKGGDA